MDKQTETQTTQALESEQGCLAQLVERLPYKEDVGSSSLSTPSLIEAT